MNVYIHPNLELRAHPNRHLGKGVFATVPIQKDEIIHVTEGKILSNIEWEKLAEKDRGHCFDINDSEVLCPKDFRHPTIDWFINHSCDPNVGSAGDFYTLVAMRDIAGGEEITMDYAMTDEDPDPRWNMECHCGAPNCRKVITGNDWKVPELQECYRGYFQKNIQEKIDALRRRR